MKPVVRTLLALLAFLVLLAVLLTGPPSPASAGEIIAHRGVHQRVRGDIARHEVSIPWDACTADLVEKVDHGYIENTLPSIQAAFDHGATVVELDFHRTADRELVVFHDFDLSCRTDSVARGCQQTSVKDKPRCLVWEHDLAFIKQLDAGYGYTTDGGKTFPLRGKGQGMIPTLGEVLDAFPGRKFVLDYKGDEGNTLPLVAALLHRYPPERRADIYWYNLREDEEKEALRLVPESKILIWDAKRIKRCGSWYLTTGWFGYVPSDCRAIHLALPYKYFKKLGPLTGPLLNRVHKKGGSLVVAYVETLEEADYVNRYPVDGVFTNHIEVVGERLKAGMAARGAGGAKKGDTAR